MLKKLILTGIVAFITFFCSAQGPLRIEQVILTPINCEVTNTGTIELTVQGGQPPYQFQLNNGPLQSENIFTNIEMQNVNIARVIDNTGTITFAEIFVGPSNFTTATLTLTQPTCTNFEDGTATITTEFPQVEFIEYDLNGEFNETGVFTNLGAGQLNIAFSADGFDPGCNTITIWIALTEPAPIEIQATTTPATCNGSKDGTITITSIENGTPPYVACLTSNTNPDFEPICITFPAQNTYTNLPGDEYALTATDTNGCDQQIDIGVTQPENIRIIDILTTPAANCPDQCDGTLEVIAESDAELEFSLNGGPFQLSSIFTNLAPGTYTVVAQQRDVPNPTCAEDTAVVGVAPQGPLRIEQVILTPIDCEVTNTGTIELTAQGGQLPYLFQLNNGPLQTENIFANIETAGINIARVIDNTEASAFAEILVGPSNFTKATLTLTQPTCTNFKDGTATITAENPLTEFIEYALNGVINETGVFTNLEAGQLDIAFSTDVFAPGCDTITILIALTEPAPIEIQATPTPTTCNGSKDGIITITSIENGTPPYNACLTSNTNPDFEPICITFPAQNTYSNLPADEYAITVTDTKGCDQQIDIVVTQPTEVSIISIIPISPSCPGQADGIVQVTGSPPEQLLTYMLNGQTIGPVIGAATFTGLTPNTYNIRVTNANNACAVDTALVPPATPVTFDPPFIQPVNCNGGNDGLIRLDEVQITSGEPPFEYSIGTEEGFKEVGLPFEGLLADQYNVVVRDAIPCLSAPLTVTVPEPPPITFTQPTVTPVTVNGGNDGSILLEEDQVTGNNPPFEYSIGTPEGFKEVGLPFEDLTADQYNVVVRDGDQCLSAPQTVTVPEPPLITFTQPMVTPVTCNGGNDGAILLEEDQVTGGTAPYQYSISTPLGFINVGIPFKNLLAGQYGVIVQDINLFQSAEQTSTVPEPEAIIFDPPTIQPVTCNGGNDGAILLEEEQITGDEPPFEYSIGTPEGFKEVGLPFEGLLADQYNVVVRDAIPCLSAPLPVTVPEPPPITFTQPMVTPVTCNGGNDGTILLEEDQVTGNNPPFEYSIETEEGFKEVGLPFEGLLADQYNVVVRDAIPCLSAEQTVTVPEPAPITFTQPTITPVTCNGGNDGAILLEENQITGDNPPFEYSIGTPEGFKEVGLPFEGLLAGSYQVVVRDGTPCLSAPVPVMVPQPNAFILNNFTSTPVTCPGDDDGTILITQADISGGTPPYNYSIGTGFQPAGTEFTNLEAGLYPVTIQDLNDCQAIVDVITVQTPEEILVTDVSTTPVSCGNVSDGSITVTSNDITGGTPPYRYSIGTAQGFKNAGESFEDLEKGLYPLTIQDSNGCLKDIGEFPVQGPEPIIITTFSISPVTCNGGNDGSINVTEVVGGVPPYVYSIGNEEFKPVGQPFTGLTAQSYTVTVADSSENECTSTPTNVVVSQPENIRIVGINTTPAANCPDQCDGTLEVIAESDAELEFSLNGGPFQLSPIFTNLAPGTYTVVAQQLDVPNPTCAVDTAVVGVAQENPIFEWFKQSCNI